jgi:hypothetical protein
VTFARYRRPPRRARELLTAAVGAFLLVLTLGLPVLGVSAGSPPGPTKLWYPDVAPRAADSATPVTFTVTYRNAHALPPDYVQVVVAGQTYPMTGAGTDWKAGVVFTVVTTLPAGTSEVRFEARDAERFVDELTAGTVSIDAAPPPPAPDPTPAPAPTPTPVPPAPPPPGGTSGSGSTGSTDTGASGGGSAGSDNGSTTGGGSESASGAGTTGHDGSSGIGDGPDGTITGRSYTWDLAAGDASGSENPGSATDPDGDGTYVHAGAWSHRPWFWSGSGSTTAAFEPAEGRGVSAPPGDSTAAGDTGGFGGSAGTGGPASWLQSSLDGGLAALGLSDSGRLPTLPAVIGSTVMVTTWMAFMLFNKRRRDGEPPAPDDVLQAAASTGIGMGMVLAPAPVGPLDPEAGMPRWRRPSLLEARKTDPIRSPAPARERLSFAIGSVDMPVGGERRTIRYAVIPLLDRPDEILASRIGELVAGDEVQIEQRSGAYCHVLCPDGRQGWVHRTTLGDIVEAPRPGGGRVPEPEPEAENALAAMLAARGLR